MQWPQSPSMQPLQVPTNQPYQQPQANPLEAANALVSQILGSPDANAAFNQMVNGSPEAQKIMAWISQYGNGDPKAGMMNYAASIGQQEMAKRAAQMFGLM